MSKEQQKSWLFSHQSRTDEDRRCNGPPAPKNQRPGQYGDSRPERSGEASCLPMQTFLSKQKNNECANATWGGPTTTVVCVLGGAGAWKEAPLCTSPTDRSGPHSQLAEAVQPCESATGVLDCARNLIVVQIPGEETQKA